MATKDQQGRERVDRLASWLRMIASFAIGTSFGILVGHWLSVRMTVNEFGALGNWVAGLGTLGALVLAYFVHRRDVTARADDLQREKMKEYNRRLDEAEKAKERDQLQQRHAGRVRASILVGSSYAGAGDSRYLDSVDLKVTNQCPEPVSDVKLMTRWPNITKSWPEVLPRKSESAEIPVLAQVELPPDQSECQEFMQEKLELQFKLYDRSWSWTPEAGLLERTDGQEVAAIRDK